MTRGHRRNKITPPPPAAPLLPDDTRARNWGAAVAAVWYLGGFVLLIAGAVMQVGPYAWAQSWQVRHLGSDSATMSFLPGFGILLVPMLVLALLPRRPDWPFVNGAKDAFWPDRRASRPVVSTDILVRRMRRSWRVMLVLALACPLVGTVLGWMSLRPGEQAPGSALPTLTMAEAAARGATLPDYARLTGGTPQPDLAWEHDFSIRTTRYQDVYTPVTAPGWRHGDAVSVLQLESLADFQQPGATEGELSRGLPAWLITSMRAGGVPVADDPVVLKRKKLDGRVPEPDEVGAILAGIFSASAGLTFGGLAFGFHRAYRRLLQQADDAATGRRR